MNLPLYFAKRADRGRVSWVWRIGATCPFPNVAEHLRKRLPGGRLIKRLRMKALIFRKVSCI